MRSRWRTVGRGESIADDEYEEIMLAAGYKDPRAGNRFFVGDMEPVLERAGRPRSLDRPRAERGEVLPQLVTAAASVRGRGVADP